MHQRKTVTIQCHSNWLTHSFLQDILLDRDEGASRCKHRDLFCCWTKPSGRCCQSSHGCA